MFNNERISNLEYNIVDHKDKLSRHDRQIDDLWNLVHELLDYLNLESQYHRNPNPYKIRKKEKKN